MLLKVHVKIVIWFSSLFELIDVFKKFKITTLIKRDIYSHYFKNFQLKKKKTFIDI